MFLMLLFLFLFALSALPSLPAATVAVAVAVAAAHVIHSKQSATERERVNVALFGARAPSLSLSLFAPLPSLLCIFVSAQKK